MITASDRLPTNPDTTHVPLRCVALPLVQIVWLALTTLGIGLFLAGLPSLYDSEYRFAEVYHGQMLAQMGVPVSAVAIYAVGFACVIVLSFVTISVQLFWQRRQDRLAILVSNALMLTSLYMTNSVFEHLADTVPAAQSPLGVLTLLMIYTGIVISITCIFILPTGTFVFPWARWLMWSGIAVFTVGWWTVPYPQSVDFATIVGVPLSFVGVFTQMYRYRRDTNRVHRQQIKWIAVGVSILLLGAGARYIATIILTAAGQLNVADLVFNVIPIYQLSTLALPLALSIAILRYRLWEVDLVLNRSLVYGGVTLVLVTFFFAALMALQEVLRASVGGDQIALVVSALAVGLTFQPLRRRLQHLVDRHFYNLRVDLNQFSMQQKKSAVKPTFPAETAIRQIGAYEVLELLGRGGMGEVYRGRQPSLGRQVAIKVLAPQFACIPDFRKRFEYEARTVASLRHPNIVNMFDFGSENGMYYMVMEFIEGARLNEHIHNADRLSLAETRWLVCDIASALDYAHEQGVIHRDIKPSNIMLQPVTATARNAPSHRAILMDFGIAKMVSDPTGLTGTDVVGTLEYLSPEQILTGDIDYRVDIYGMGILVYQMLTGELPFKTEGVGQLLFAHLNQPPPDIRGVRPELSWPVAAAIMKAMAKAPADRFQSAGAFAAALLED